MIRKACAVFSTGTESYNELIVIRNQVTEILTVAGCNLTKWFSNHSEFSFEWETNT